MSWVLSQAATADFELTQPSDSEARWRIALKTGDEFSKGPAPEYSTDLYPHLKKDYSFSSSYVRGATRMTKMWQQFLFEKSSTLEKKGCWTQRWTQEWHEDGKQEATAFSLSWYKN